jgi:prevent-host-death family protein
MTDTWTVQAAKARLSELLRRARAGEAQRIGVTDACVVISEKRWAALRTTDDLGAWLVDSAPLGHDIELPPRGSRRENPFADFPAGDRPSSRARR